MANLEATGGSAPELETIKAQIAKEEQALEEEEARIEREKQESTERVEALREQHSKIADEQLRASQYPLEFAIDNVLAAHGIQKQERAQLKENLEKAATEELRKREERHEQEEWIREKTPELEQYEQLLARVTDELEELQRQSIEGLDAVSQETQNPEYQKRVHALETTIEDSEKKLQKKPLIFRGGAEKRQTILENARAELKTLRGEIWKRQIEIYNRVLRFINEHDDRYRSGEPDRDRIASIYANLLKRWNETDRTEGQFSAFNERVDQLIAEKKALLEKMQTLRKEIYERIH